MRRSQPEAHCPICGRHAGRDQQSHRCPKATLSAINAANTRAENAEGEVFCEALVRNEASRLLEGFAILRRWRDGD